MRILRQPMNIQSDRIFAFCIYFLIMPISSLWRPLLSIPRSVRRSGLLSSGTKHCPQTGCHSSSDTLTYWRSRPSYVEIEPILVTNFSWRFISLWSKQVKAICIEVCYFCVGGVWPINASGPTQLGHRQVSRTPSIISTT